jgi:hypothetical protein
MKHIFSIAFCLMTISGFGQRGERFKEGYHDFETLYDAIIIKTNGDRLIGKTDHLKYPVTKFFYTEKIKIIVFKR